ncbi:hypothetical protein HYV89_01840 [Candidatus Woesearchaeota archaeon]|nr:hypothetical protein [Candidatus Woesearchaeota archaeon]
MNWEEFLEKHYKKLFVVPAIMLIFSLIVVGIFLNKTGELFYRDVSLKGGISATVYEKGIDAEKLEKFLEDELGTDVFVRKLGDIATDSDIGVVVEIGDEATGELKKLIEENIGRGLNEKNFSIEQVSSSLGESFYNGLLKAVVISFALMGLVIFVAFRSFVPSAAVLLSAFLDIVFPLSIMELAGVKINAAGIAAFLLVIGYSVDTDILLTVKALKRKEGNIYQRIIDSAKTGLTMTLATVCALGIAYFITTSFVLKQMFMIIVIALLVDIVSTYFMNSGILIWYCKKRGENEKFWG